MVRFSQRQTNSSHVCTAGMDTELDMAAQTIVAVCEYHGAPTTQLYTPQNYLMNTTLCCQVFCHFWDSHNSYCAEMMIKLAVVNDRKWQAPLPLDTAS